MVHAADPCTRHQTICGGHSRGMPPSPHRWHRLEPALGPLQNQTTVGVAHYCWSASAAKTSPRDLASTLPPPEGWGTDTYPLFRAPYYRRYNYRKEELQGTAPRPLYMRVSSHSREYLCAMHAVFCERLCVDNGAVGERLCVDNSPIPQACPRPHVTFLMCEGLGRSSRLESVGIALASGYTRSTIFNCFLKFTRKSTSRSYSAPN